MIGQGLKFILVLAATLAIFAAVVWWFRTDFIYPFGDVAADPGDMPRTEVRSIPAFGDDPALTVWLTEPVGDAPYIIYFMGLGGSLSFYEPRMRSLADAGFGIAAMAYRGSGEQDGVPSEASLMKDARRLYTGLDRLAGREISENDRVIYGFSFGSLIATTLAAEQEELAVVLESPGERLCDMGFKGYALLPHCAFFKDNEFDAARRIGRIDAPVLFIIGDADQVAKGAGMSLYAAAPEPKFLEVYPGGGHGDLGRFGAAERAIGFLNTLRGAR